MTARPSLLRRLLGISLAVTLLAVAGTAWASAVIANRSSSRPPDQSHARSVVYSTLLAFAATHRSWSGVAPLVSRLARANDVRIEVSDLQQRLLSTAAPPGGATAAPVPISVVDTLNVNNGLSTVDSPDGIYPLNRDPLAVSPRQRRAVESSADAVVACAHKLWKPPIRLDHDSFGRPRIRGVPDKIIEYCGGENLLKAQFFPEQGKALAQVEAIATPCLRARSLPVVSVRPDYSFAAPAGASQAELAGIRSCITGARRVQLTPYVAPPVLLLVGGLLPPARLAARDLASIAAVAALVLALAIVATVLASRRVARPLGALTRAVREDADHDGDLAVTGTPREVADLADALDRSRRDRRELEAQRRASIGDIAHELRTPLTNIRAWLEARRDGLADDVGLDAQLLDETRTLQELIDDLQLISVAESGRLRLRFESFELADLLEQVRVAHGAAAAGARIAVDVPHPTRLEADQLRLRQVLDNLVSNAIRAVQEAGGGRIEITGRTDGACVIIAVHDTGSGISPADLPHLFERFWRADPSRSRATGGSGLGLAIAGQLVAAHRGDIAVTSRPGAGTTFTVTLPARHEA